MKIGIAGIGFVGDAMVSSFEKLGVDLVKYDKFKDGGIGRPEDLIKTDICFLCLPTLYNKKSSSYNLSAIEEVCTFLTKNQYQGTVVIKSTVEPGKSQMLADKYELKIVHNPEFLTARTAREDFEKQDHIVLGQTSIASKDPTVLANLMQFYSKLYPNAEISTSTSGESESMKIFVNSFYAIKVQAFNEFYLYSKNQGNNYNTILNMMLKNGWINPMHTNVPGPDGQLSYGGACFPKDTKALLAHMKLANTPHRVLRGCVKEQKRMRKD